MKRKSKDVAFYRISSGLCVQCVLLSLPSSIIQSWSELLLPPVVSCTRSCGGLFLTNLFSHICTRRPGDIVLAVAQCTAILCPRSEGLPVITYTNMVVHEATSVSTSLIDSVSPQRGSESIRSRTVVGEPCCPC